MTSVCACTTHSYLGISCVIGVSAIAGLVVCHLINPAATERTVEKICAVFKAIYSSLTWNNIQVFTGTIVCCILAAGGIISVFKVCVLGEL